MQTAAAFALDEGRPKLRRWPLPPLRLKRAASGVAGLRSAPLKKADLLAVAHYLIGHLSYSQVPSLAKRHKVEAKKDSASAQELLAISASFSTRKGFVQPYSPAC
jgi:hypothetical protein